MTGEGHLDQRGEHAAVGAIVIGQHQVLRAQLRQRSSERVSSVGSSRSGGVAPSAPCTCASDEPPRRLRAAAEIDQQQRGRAEIGAQLRSPGLARIAHRREGRDDERHGRDHRLAARRRRSTPSSSTANPCPPGWRCPAPGTAPRPRRAPWRTARRLRRARRRPPSSWPTGARSKSEPMSAARMLVSASPTASRPKPVRRAPPPACVRPWPWLRRRGRSSRTGSPRRRPPAPATARPSGRG